MRIYREGAITVAQLKKALEGIPDVARDRCRHGAHVSLIDKEDPSGGTPMNLQATIRPTDRPMLAFILRHCPSARRMWVKLKRLGMTRIRPDAFPWEPFPSMWVASCRWDLTVGLVCDRDGQWSLHS